MNEDKTHLVVMTTDQFRRQNDVIVRMIAGEEVINSTEVEKLLGVYIHQGMK